MKKKQILGIILVILSVFILMFETYLHYKDTGEIDQNKIGEALNIIQDEIKEINQSSTEIPQMAETDEKNLELQEVEDENFELQGEIAYEGGKAESWNLEAKGQPQLTYISQIDSRWRKYPYTSTGNTSQTIGSSGCGVASAAMIIDSIVGNVNVTELADTFVKYGYRSPNNGTYWSAYRAIADEFNIEYQETSNFETMLNKLRNSNYIICSVGNGLFTTGGHYIVIYAADNDTLKIYDPYLYAGKFETSTRRGKVKVRGNTVYCSIDNFKRYANYKQFFCYKYDTNKVDTNNSTDNEVRTENYTRYVKVSSRLNVRSGASTSDKIVTTLQNGELVTVYETKGNWSRIGENRWVCSDYLSTTAYISQTVQKVNSTGQIKKIKACTLYSNSNLSGKRYTYKANTTVIILSNINSYIDRVKVNATGRIAYINTNNYLNSSNTSSNSTKVKNTVGQYKRLKYKTTLYSKSSLIGSKHNYLANTQVRIVKNVSSNVDYVYVVKTRKYLYVRNNVYK